MVHSVRAHFPSPLAYLGNQVEKLENKNIAVLMGANIANEAR